MNPMRLFLAAALVAALSLVFPTLPAVAHSVKVGSLELSGLWTRATPPRAPAAGGYLTITNTGEEPDRLIAVSSPWARLGEMHEMTVKDEVMTMRPVETGLSIPPGESVTLAPGGFHLMFIDLKEPLVEGGEFPVRLTFEKAGSVETVLHVEGIGARGPGGDEHEGDHMP
jgi:copper(I)-binding protein